MHKTFVNLSNKPRCSAAALAIAMAALVAAPAVAVDRTWNGVNATGGNGGTDVNNPNNWTTTTVPTTGDKAIFIFSNSSTAVLDIPNTATDFQPDNLTLSAGTGTTSALAINKDLTLNTLAAAASGTTANSYLSRLRVSTTRNTTLTLTGASPIDVYGLAGWRTINAGTNGFFSTFNLTNADILFKTLNTGAAPGVDKNVSHFTGIQGGSISQANINSNPQFNFTVSNGTITLQTASQRPEGTLGLGFTQMGVYSTQTWAYIPDANNQNTSFIRMGYRMGTAGVAGPEMIRALDSQRLDNLTNVNLVLDLNNFQLATNSDATTAMRIAPGTYGSLNWAIDRDINGINHYLKLNGDVTFSGNAVEPGFFDSNFPNIPTPPTPRSAATSTQYGLILRGGDSSGANDFVSRKRLILDGRTLTVTNGVLLDDRLRSGTGRRGWVHLDATGSALNIGGNLVLNSVNQGGSALGGAITQNIGIFGNGSTTVNLGGNFVTNVVSSTLAGTSQGLSGSAVNMIGGSANVRTWEVAAWSGQTAFNTGYAIGTFSVGTATTVGRVQLVNDFLNDDTAVTLLHDGDKTGEKLMVANLKVAAGSTLDVNAQVVSINTSLFIDPTALLDLNTGLSLNEEDLVSTFTGIGNQVATWNTFASRVIDSDNPTLAFTATTSGGNTVWQATAAPEPGSMAALLIGACGLCTRRRRR